MIKIPSVEGSWLSLVLVLPNLKRYEEKCFDEEGVKVFISKNC